MKLRNLFLFLFFVGIIVAGITSILFHMNPAQAVVYGGGPGDSTSVSSPTASSLYVSWSTSYAGVTSQSIYRNNSYIATVGSGSGYTSSGLSCGTTYSYYVCSNYGCSSSGSGTTVACAPAAPTGFSATAASQSQINLSWTASAGASGYYLYKNGSYIGSTAATSYSDTGLSCNGGGTYYAVAYNAGGNSGNSNSSAASTDQCTPGTPTIGTATTSGSTTATVTWTRNYPYTESGFEIWSSGGVYRGSAGAGATSGSATGLAASTPYAFYVRAYVTTNGRTYYSGNSANSNTITTYPPAPATPTGFTVFGSGTSSLDLSWNAVSGATSYTVTRTGYGTVYSGTGTSFSDTGLTCNTSYSYTIYASNSGGNSATASTSGTTLVCIPSAPTGLSATAVSGSQINLSWAAVSGATGYYVYRGGVYIGSSGTTSYSDTGLSCNTSYSYYVIAYNSSGSSAASATVSATTYICSPTGFTVSGTSGTTLSLSWNAVTGATSYAVVTYTGGQPVYSGSGTSASVSGLTCNTSYSYSITASNAQSTSANVIGSGSTYVCPPATPTGLSATAASQTQANLTWTDNATNETGYYVYRGGVLVATLGVNSTSYNDTSLSCGTSYSYYVVAYNAGGTSAASNTASATTVVCTPATPTGLSATPLTGCSQISLSWTDNATNETGYYVYRGGALAATLAANSTSYTDGGLTGATSYSYFVRAYNAGGNADSNTASASTNSCVSSPGSPSSGMTVGTVISTDLGRPMTSLSWSGSANGFIVVRYNTTDGYHLVIDTSGASAIDQTNIRCPATYTYYIYGYNTDTSLGTTDSSCTSQSPLTSAGASLTNKKCSAPVAVVRNMDYCTKGFFNN